MCEHSVLYCVFGLSVFSSFFPLSFANCEMDKWTQRHRHKRLECTNKHRTKTHLFIVVILSMNNNKKTINNENTSRRAYTLHMEFSTMLLDYVIYELENLNTRFWRYSILFFFTKRKQFVAIHKHKLVTARGAYNRQRQRGQKDVVATGTCEGERKMHRKPKCVQTARQRRRWFSGWHQYALIAQYFVGDNEAIAGNEHIAIKYA